MEQKENRLITIRNGLSELLTSLGIYFDKITEADEKKIAAWIIKTELSARKDERERVEKELLKIPRIAMTTRIGMYNPLPKDEFYVKSDDISLALKGLDNNK